jgi:hypothetical protein
MYIKYTIFDLLGVFTRRVHGTIALTMSIAIIAQSHNIDIRSRIGLLLKGESWLASLLEVSLLSLLARFLKTGGVSDHQHLMLLPY